MEGMVEKKGKIIQAVVCVVLVCLIWGGYFLSVNLIRQNNRVKNIKNQVETLDYNVLFGIEAVDTRDNKISFSGWAFRRGVDNVGIDMVLQPTDDTGSEVLEVELLAREDINEKFELGIENCGFKTEINKSRIEEDRCYEILLALSYKEKDNAGEGKVEVTKKITTNRFLYNGEVYRYNPIEFEMPKLSDENIQFVLNQGKMYAYDAEKKVWIYQYENRLFCVADVAYAVPLEKVPSVPVAFYTFFEELVPEERKERFFENGFDYLEIYFNEEHYVVGEDSQYYVATVELPEYPITYVRMGTYGNRGEGWISRNEFQMDIVIE